MASSFHCESVSKQLVAKGCRVMWSVAESASCRNSCFSSYSFAVQLGRKFSVCVHPMRTSVMDRDEGTEV